MSSESDFHGPEAAPVPPEIQAVSLWVRYRRLALVVVLAVALGVVILSLRPEARMSILTALLAQRRLIVAVLVFGLIMLSLVWSAGQRLDAWVFLFFNLRGPRPAWLDRVMWMTTQIGNMGSAFTGAVLFFVLNYRRLAIEIILGTLTLWIGVEIVKAITDRTRPFLLLQGARVIGWRERGRSFPSGHTAQTFFLMTMLSHRFDLGPVWTAALYCLAVLVGFTRVYVGAHYPRDVIGGGLFGWVWGILLILLDPFLLGRPM